MKTFLRWAIVGCSIIFIGQAIARHWQAVSALTLTTASGGWLLLAGLVTLTAHVWAGWVWHWLLQLWNQPGSSRWSMRVFLYTNLMKYLPGNVWHFVGRVRAVTDIGGSLGGAVASVVAEPLLMAAGAVGVAAIASTLAYVCAMLSGETDVVAGTLTYGNNIISGSVVPAQEALTVWQRLEQLSYGPLWPLGLFGLWAIALILLSPRLLNPRLRQMGQVKLSQFKRSQFKHSQSSPGKFGHSTLNPDQSEPDSATEASADWQQSRITDAATDQADGQPESQPEIIDGPPLQLKRYPLRPLLGEMGFVLIRAVGFILAVRALTPLAAADLPGLVADFSLAWVAGLVVPGAPGGIGVFEAVAIALISGQLPPAIILGSVACYRLVSVLSEVVGAGLAWLFERIVSAADGA